MQSHTSYAKAWNSPFVLNKIFLVQTIIITFIYLLALFIVQNLKKFLQQIQSYKDAPFLGQQWPFVMNKFFLVQTIIITFIYLLAIFIGPFHCSKFQKHSYSGSRVMKMHHFWVQNSPFVQMRIFSENLLMLYSFHSCLSTCQKSRSGINLLVKYWQLKNTE